jgi:UDP-N-acetylglucosamine 2-epimerase
MYKIAVVLGTRPEVIKLASVVQAFEAYSNVTVNICLSGQHLEMVTPLLSLFDLRVDKDLTLMERDQTLSVLTSKAVRAFGSYFESLRPDLVIVQGDTTTAMCAAVAAFYAKIDVAHVEAGLRTWDVLSPFPEEFNRRVIGSIAARHFAPTDSAKQNLIREGVSSEAVLVSGNTVIDTLFYTLDLLSAIKPEKRRIDAWGRNNRRFVLITAHRRENFGEGFENICAALLALSGAFGEVDFVFPVHLNPNVQKPVYEKLGCIDNVYLIPPLSYVEFVSVMKDCHFILTDSGGLQEEGPSLGKPVLVLRSETERPEGVENGNAKLIGTEAEHIVKASALLLRSERAYQEMVTSTNPFGDGMAAQRIAASLVEYLEG